MVTKAVPNGVLSRAVTPFKVTGRGVTLAGNVFSRLCLRLLLGEKYPFPGTFPVDRYSLEPLLPGHTVDPLDCFERGVFGKIYGRANSLIDMSLQGSLH